MKLYDESQLQSVTGIDLVCSTSPSWFSASEQPVEIIDTLQVRVALNFRLPADRTPRHRPANLRTTDERPSPNANSEWPRIRASNTILQNMQWHCHCNDIATEKVIQIHVRRCRLRGLRPLRAHYLIFRNSIETTKARTRFGMPCTTQSALTNTYQLLALF